MKCFMLLYDRTLNVIFNRLCNITANLRLLKENKNKTKINKYEVKYN